MELLQHHRVGLLEVWGVYTDGVTLRLATGTLVHKSQNPELPNSPEPSGPAKQFLSKGELLLLSWRPAKTSLEAAAS